MFAPSDIDAVDRLLVDRCGPNLAGFETASTDLVDRVRSAAIRFSAGRMDLLRQAVDLAAVDWRDLLVAAGFAEDVSAHTPWQPRPFNADILNQWFAQGSLPDVMFSPNQLVTVTIGPDQTQSASVISLEALEPEPQYSVELASGADLTVFQRNLAAAD